MGNLICSVEREATFPSLPGDNYTADQSGMQWIATRVTMLYNIMKYQPLPCISAIPHNTTAGDPSVTPAAWMEIYKLRKDPIVPHKLVILGKNWSYWAKTGHARRKLVILGKNWSC